MFTSLDELVDVIILWFARSVNAVPGFFNVPFSKFSSTHLKTWRSMRIAMLLWTSWSYCFVLMETGESLPPELFFIHSSRWAIWRSRVTRSSKWRHKREEMYICHISNSNGILHIFIFIIYSFEDTNRFMRCCAVNLRLDNQQCNDTNPHQPDDTKLQQRDDAEAKMQKSESLTWKTAKEASSNRCKHPQLELSTDKSHQQHESANCSKFMRNLRAWFTNGGSPW